MEINLPMKLLKKYQIQNWTVWYETINQSIIQFHEEFSFYPTILEANNYTFSQFDFLINIVPNEKKNVFRINELTNIKENISEKENVMISGFKTANTEIDFSVDEELNDKEFRLIYDSNPDWDNDNPEMDLPLTKKEIVKV